jgi:hypothetical protein
VCRFLFATSSDAWLTVLRAGIGLEVFLYACSLHADWTGLFSTGDNLLIDRQLSEAITSFYSVAMPRVSWFVGIGNSLGLREAATLNLVWIALAISSLLLVAGLFSRTAAVVTWLLHLAAVKSGGLISYGVDNLTTIGLFYLVLAPLPDSLSFDARRKAIRGKARWFGFYRRVLQCHLCVIYFVGGVAKALGPGWWDGGSLWRALTRPPFQVLPFDWLLMIRALLPLSGIAVMAIELLYPVFIWSRRTRPWWLGAMIVVHVGTAVAMGLYLFALVMIVLNLAAFGADYILPAKLKVRNYRRFAAPGTAS